MARVILKEVGDGYVQEFPQAGLIHSKAINAVVEDAQDAADAPRVIEVPFGNEKNITFMCAFAATHANDEPVEIGWEKQRPRELTPWDKENLRPFVGMELVHLLKATNFIGNQMMLNAVGTYVGSIMESMNEVDIQKYFGVMREFSKQDEAEVKAKYPVILNLNQSQSYSLIISCPSTEIDQNLLKRIKILYDGHQIDVCVNSRTFYIHLL